MYIFTMPILLVLSCVVIIPTWNPKPNKISQEKCEENLTPHKTAVGFPSSVSTSWVWAWTASAKNPSRATFVEGLVHRWLGTENTADLGTPNWWLKATEIPGFFQENMENPGWWNIISFGQNGWVFVWRYWSNRLIVGLGYGMLWVIHSLTQRVFV